MKNNKVRVGIIEGKINTSKEINSILKIFSGENNILLKKISFQKISDEKELKKKYDVLWWHYDESTLLPEISNSDNVIENILCFVEKGGGLLLSLLAAQYVYNLRLEDRPPDVVFKGPWDRVSWVKEYPDIRGFHGYLGHSIFRNLNKGVYTWSPQQGEDFCETYYSSHYFSEKRKTAAIGRAKISFEDKVRLINEYDYGKGKILTVGSYFFFSHENKIFQNELKYFTLNCLDFLKNQFDKSSNTYWPDEKFEVLPLPPKKSKFGYKRHNCSFISSDLEFSGKSSENFFNITGRRTLVIGKENGGISEIWFHPLRALKDYGFSILTKDSKILKDVELKSAYNYQPEAVQREYQWKETKIKEMIFASFEKPGAVVSYDFNTKENLYFIIRFCVDLRFMWPYPNSVLGSIKYYWDAGLKSFVIMNYDERFFVHIGTQNDPDEVLAGRYSSVEVEKGKLIGIKTDEKQLFIALKFKIDKTRNRSFSLVVSASCDGKTESLETYKSLISNPAKYYLEQKKYYKKLLNKSVIVETPDREFNDGYKWALVGIDKFFSETPQLGKSFLAGYANTTPGWGDGRPGYAWYFGRDSIWTSFAVLKYGDFEKVKDTIEFLGKLQNVDGKIFHEVTTSGCVHYDSADSTPLYIILCGYYLKATGDLAFIKKEWDHIKKAVDFCFSTDSDKDHLIENTNVGHGWIEGGKLFPVHSETYLIGCWAEALRESGYMAEKLKLSRLPSLYKKESRVVENILNDIFWNPPANFYNFGKYQNGTFNSEKTSIVSVPLLFGLAHHDKAFKVLYEYAGSNFSSDWGVRVIREDSKLFNPKGYHYGAVWPLFTGWTALAEFKHLRGVQGFTHLMNNLLIYKNWSKGFIQEVLNGEEYLPTGVCSHQAWSESMVIQPALEGMLGLETDVLNNKVTLSPDFPAHWETVNIKNIIFGGERINLKFKRDRSKYLFEFTKSGKKPVDMEFMPVLLKGIILEKVTINNQPYEVKKEKFDVNTGYLFYFKLREKTKILISFSGGVMVLPYLSKVHIGAKSRGMRIIKDEFSGNEYKVLIEGKRENSYTFQVYCNNMKIRDVEGAEIISRNKNIYNILIGFEDSHDKYYNKMVTMRF